MESEKVKEIKKALEHCAEEITCQGCPGYNNEPVIDWFKCKKNLAHKTITLINELEKANNTKYDAMVALFKEQELYKKRNEILKDENERLIDQRNKTYNIWVKDTEKLKDRIAELEKELETRKAEVLHLQEYGKKLIRETELKQFAERLKEKVKNFCGTEYENAYYDVTKSFACTEIDETLKECLCEKQV